MTTFARKRVLHITPHLGCGVGTVLRALLSAKHYRKECRNEIIALESVNSSTQRWAREWDIPLFSEAILQPEEVMRRYHQADIVHLHWWNHPLLHQFMAKWTLPDHRLLLWSHVNGHAPPQYLTRYIVDYPDRMVLASPHSLETPAIQALSPAVKDKKVSVLQSIGGLPASSGQTTLPAPDTPIRIGYVGTVDYCKMHPNFIKLAIDAQLDEVKFIVAGGPEETRLRNEVISAGYTEQFDILGPVSDVASLYPTFNIFGYPLNPNHYGTGEQVLIEAMSFAIPPVVIDTGCERYIIDDGETGLIASTEKEYSKALRHLAHQPAFRRKMGFQAREVAQERFSLQETEQGWLELYQQIMAEPKRPHTLNPLTLDETPLGIGSQLLYNSVIGHPLAKTLKDLLFTENPPDELHTISGLINLLSATRGSPFHYYHFFPQDDRLARLCRLLKPLRSMTTDKVTL